MSETLVPVSFWGEGPSAQEHRDVAKRLGMAALTIRQGVDLRKDEVAVRHLLPKIQRSCAVFSVHFPDREGKPFEASLRWDWRKACKDGMTDETICGRTLGECLFRTAQALLNAGWNPS